MDTCRYRERLYELYRKEDDRLTGGPGWEKFPLFWFLLFLSYKCTRMCEYCYVFNQVGYDDALDTFGVHGVGGTLGAILTGVFADPKANSVVEGLKDGLVLAQIKAVLLTVVWSVVASAVIALIVKAVIGLRPDRDVERAGLDLAEHGEVGYEE